MSTEFFLELLARHAVENPQQVAEGLAGLSTRLVEVLKTLPPSDRHLLLGELTTRILESTEQAEAGSTVTPSQEITPELKEWACRQFSEEEIVESLREIRATGGMELHEFIKDLEQAAGLHE